MNKEGMLSLDGRAFIGVQTQKPDTLAYIRLKKQIETGIYDPEYDYNGDGVLDGKDLMLLKKYLLGVISSEELQTAGGVTDV